MAAPIPFDSLTDALQQEMIDERRETTIIVPRSVAGVGALDAATRPDRRFPRHSEVPPTPIILTTPAAFQLYMYSSGDPRGHWMRLMVLVYRLGGRILYREIDDETLEAVVLFS